MPRAVDKHPQQRGTGNALYNPLRSGVASWEDPLSAVAHDMEGIGGEFRGVFSSLGALFGLPSPEEIVVGVANGVGSVIQGAVELVGGLGGFFAGLVGGFIDGSLIPILDPTKILNLPALFSDVVNIATGIFNGWFGGGGTGTVAEVTYTIEKIKDAVINGYNVITFTSDTAGWAVPEHVEIVGLLIGGGENGNGNFGGKHGSFIAIPMDLTGVTALDIRVGTAGNRSYIRAANSSPHTGTVIAESAVHGSAGGVAGTFGLTATSSVPGNGGNGGTAGNGRIMPEPGQPSALAAGGAAGSSTSFGGPGGAGGSVSAGSLIKCGGGGGGGGGGAGTVFNGGGNGGAGGYPGGGGGGLGNGFSAANGLSGPGAPGVVWIFYR